MQRLGRARRTLGQKSGQWTEQKNQALLKEIDRNGDGAIDGDEFAQHFARALPVLLVFCNWRAELLLLGLSAAWVGRQIQSSLS